jgi:hypothetical protein
LQILEEQRKIEERIVVIRYLAMGEIDNLLARLKAEYRERENPLPKPSPSSSTEIDRLLAQVKAGYSPPRESIVPALPTNLPEREKPEDKAREQIEVRREQRQRSARRAQAQKWLATLDPQSDEGKWFEEFASTHDSPLEAAMIYLEALREVSF